jgi:hypothetical protein
MKWDLQDFAFAIIVATGAIGVLVGVCWVGYRLGDWYGAVSTPFAFWGLARSIVDVLDAREENERRRHY